MNYKDVALVNSSLDSFTDTLLKRKMMEQQERQDLRRDALSREMMAGQERRYGDEQDARKAQYDAQKQHWGNVEAATTATTQEKVKENAHRMWGDTVKMYGEWVKDGIMKPEVAQKGLRFALDKMPPQGREILADHPVVQALDSGEFSFSGPPAKGTMETAGTRNMQAYQQSMAEAKALRESGDEKGAALKEEMAKTFLLPKQNADDTGYETVTESPDPMDEGKTIKRVSYKQPRGTAPAAPAKDDPDLQEALNAMKPKSQGGLGKVPYEVKKRYQERTGKPFPQ